jgi:hypothetical protein
LPTALAVAEGTLRLPRDTARFVLTVGATANQNGTALYEGVVVLFLAQVYGIELSVGQQLQVVLMSILAGIGTAGVPGGSLPLIAVLARSVGVPAEGIGARALIDALREQVARVARDGVSPTELARVTTQWVASQTYKRDALFSQANELGSNWLLGFPIDASRQLVHHLRSITAAEVQAVAERYFGDDQLTEAVLVPQAGDGPPPTRRGRLDMGDTPTRAH